MREYILFDLDGTLTDPKEGITKSVQYALKHYGIEEPDLDKLCPFIGPPLSDSFRRFYGFSTEQAKEAIQVYREYYGSRGWKENLEIPGTKQMLEHLKAAGKCLLVATSKPEYFARKVLDYFELTSYFRWIGGADLEETRVRKADVIRYILETSGIGMDPETLKRAVMVGDREHDVLGAREVGMDCIGVLYGYGSCQELKESGALAVVRTPQELEELLLGSASRKEPAL